MRTILVIDDDVDLADTVKSILEYEGYDALVSHDAKDGLRLAKDKIPDLILMDVMLPGMSGAEAVRELKADPLLRGIRVIFLTGLVGHEETSLEQKGLNVDGQQYQTLAKPFENRKLLEMIQSILG